ncbi:MAG: N-acetylmuramoyl-L-alanine amidase [Candidatus Omnitrophica bacterium]|nr:N-acetylmuramoyl-L-alanine amidase [Candidatus Omnitrophota bacterium]
MKRVVFFGIFGNCFRRAAVVLLLAVSVAGCVSRHQSAPNKELLQASVRVGKVRYIPLAEVCRYYGFTEEGDGLSPIISLKTGVSSAKILPGSSWVLWYGQVRDLRAPVLVRGGQTLVPVSLLQIFGQAAAAPAAAADRDSRRVSLRSVVIDAGHGGHDPGALSSFGGAEKDIVFDIAVRVQKELSERGMTVVMVRSEDRFVPLEERYAIANRSKADLFVSIHANSSRSAAAQGFEAYYLSDEYDDFSKAVAERENAALAFEQGAAASLPDINATLWDMMFSEYRIESIEIARSIAAEMKRMLKIPTRYIKGAKFVVLKGVRMPAILLEVGYLSNRYEAAQLKNPFYRQMLAEAIVAGIMNYRQRFEMTGGFSR